MKRFDAVEDAVLNALGNATLTLAGLVQSIHNAHAEIKHVAFVKTADLSKFTVWVRYHDRTSDYFQFVRQTEGAIQ